MPEMPVKESRLPDLRLPEIKRDEIVRALSDRLPEIELPDIDLRQVDIRRAMENAAIRVGVRERTRSRWPIVAGLAIVGSIGVIALLRRPAVRAQVEATAKKARARIEDMRLERERASLSVEEVETAVGAGHDPVAVGPGPKPRNTRTRVKDVAEAFDDADATPNQFEEGLSPTTDILAAAAEGTPAFEESSSRS